AASQFAAHCRRFVGRGNHLRLRPKRPTGLGFVPPCEGGKTPLRLAEFDRPAGVVDRRLDLAAVTDDARVTEQPGDIARTHSCDAFDLESVEDLAEAFALAQDGQPRESRLKPLEHDLL